MTYTVIDQFQQKFGAAVSIALNHSQYYLHIGIMSVAHKFLSHYKVIDIFPNTSIKYFSAYYIPDIFLRSGVKQ